MFGWLSADAAFASLRNRSSACWSCAIPSDRNLSATSRSSRVSFALYTPHPSRLSRACRRCGNARWSARSWRPVNQCRGGKSELHVASRIHKRRVWSISVKKRRAFELAGSRALASEQDHCKAPASEPGPQSPDIVENGRAKKNSRAAPPVPRDDLDAYVKPSLGGGCFASGMWDLLGGVAVTMVPGAGLRG